MTLKSEPLSIRYSDQISCWELYCQGNTYARYNYIFPRKLSCCDYMLGFNAMLGSIPLSSKVYHMTSILSMAVAGTFCISTQSCLNQFLSYKSNVPTVPWY